MERRKFFRLFFYIIQAMGPHVETHGRASFGNICVSWEYLRLLGIFASLGNICVSWEYLRLLEICTVIYYKKHTKTCTIIDTHGRASLGNRHKKGDVIARVSLIFWGIILILI